MNKLIIVLSTAMVGVIVLQIWIIRMLREIIWHNRYLMSLFKKPYSMNEPAKICKNCRYRLSYIQLEGDHVGDFYYVCRKHKREIDLFLTCPSFKDDHMNEPNIKK